MSVEVVVVRREHLETCVDCRKKLRCLIVDKVVVPARIEDNVADAADVAGVSIATALLFLDELGLLDEERVGMLGLDGSDDDDDEEDEE